MAWPAGQGQHHGQGVATPFVPACVQDGVELALEVGLERVEQPQVIGAVSIEEGELPLLVVQVDADAVGVAGHGQGHPRAAEGLVHPTLLQADEPHAVLWGLVQLALATGRALDDPQAPVALAAHHHLPVVAAAGEAPAGQDARAIVEALGLAGAPLGQEPALHHCVALGELQERVGRGGIQLEGLWGWERSETRFQAMKEAEGPARGRLMGGPSSLGEEPSRPHPRTRGV